MLDSLELLLYDEPVDAICLRSVHFSLYVGSTSDKRNSSRFSVYWSEEMKEIFIGEKKIE